MGWLSVKAVSGSGTLQGRDLTLHREEGSSRAQLLYTSEPTTVRGMATQGAGPWAAALPTPPLICTLTTPHEVCILPWCPHEEEAAHAGSRASGPSANLCTPLLHKPFHSVNKCLLRLLLPGAFRQERGGKKPTKTATGPKSGGAEGLGILYQGLQ